MKLPVILLVILASLGLGGCASLLLGTGPGAHHQNASSLVDYLYPDGPVPPANSVPELRIPLRVGLAFLPSSSPADLNELDLAHQQQLLERVQQRFSSRSFVAQITLIPAYYLTSRRGFDGLSAIQRLYGLDLVALVSYDQVTHSDENYWSLGYLTIVGAYMLKGDRHDVATLLDLAVVDPATRSLILRAGGTDTRHGNTTLVDSQLRTREDSMASYDAAANQMMEHFDAALTAFEADVRAGKASVRVSHKAGMPAGGAGALDWPMLLVMLLLTGLPVGRRLRLTPAALR